VPLKARKRSSRRPASIHPQGDDRVHPLGSKGDQRNSFQRDRDRVLYSSSLRRLAGVTQVVHAAEGHIFHNRLTHTLKVAQVARRIAENTIKNVSPDLVKAIGGIDPDVAETAALAHDLGHPPFGHIAETELYQQLRSRGFSDGFEGNAQSFRIVTGLSITTLNYRGLNLTRASLNAILKYPWGRATAGKKSQKWGYYHGDLSDFDFARKLGPSGDNQSPEAAIMDWADDVAYSVHDVDDFYRAGLIPLDQLLLGSAELDRFIDAVFTRWEADKNDKQNKLRLGEFNRNSAAEFFKSDLRFFAEAEDLDSAFTGTRVQLARLSYLSTVLIRRYVLGPEDGVDVKAVSVDDSAQPSVRIEPRLRAEVDLLKALMQYYVFHNPALVTQQFGQRRVISDLFQIYFEAVQVSSKNGSIVPYPFRDYLDAIKGVDELNRARLVADLIASMTEQQALLLHQRLTGIAPGSIRDSMAG
jgi:dGTPase